MRKNTNCAITLLQESFNLLPLVYFVFLYLNQGLLTLYCICLGSLLYFHKL